MKLFEGREYVKIKSGSAVLMNGKLDNWTPDDARTRHNVVLKTMNDKYLSMVFNVVTQKPYPNRVRIALTGIFWADSMYAGYRKLEAWKDDLIFYTCIDGVLIPHIEPKIRKKVVKKICLLENIMQEMIAREG